MIRLTRQTDYGIVLLTRMAVGPAELFTAPELSEATRIPHPTVQKILKILARDGLLDSQRGAKGGYTLSRPPAEISVADVVVALEGPIALTACVDEAEEDCTQEAFCPVNGNWQRINDAVRGALEGITLDSMLHRPQLVQLGGASV